MSGDVGGGGGGGQVLSLNALDSLGPLEGPKGGLQRPLNPRTDTPNPALARTQVLRGLGRGASGVVYEAQPRDAETAARWPLVAIKKVVFVCARV